MRADEATLAVAREWIARAEGDFLAATHLLRLRATSPTEAVCFHAQQCVEKYLKSLLILHGTEVPKTHDLDRLVQMLPRGVGIGLTPAERAALTSHAVAARYPGAGEIPLSEARSAMRLARRARAATRRLLPLAIKRAARGRG